MYGIYAWFGYLLPLEERLRMIRGAGFGSVMLWWGNDFRDLDGDKRGHPDLARRCGLTVENVHAPYQYANDLWNEGINGDNWEALMTACIKQCAACGVLTLVMHITDGPSPPQPTKTGIRRLHRMIGAAERCRVVLALENVQRPEYLDLVLKRPSSDCLGFCYDSGHEFACSGRYRLLPKYAGILRALHLHDNNGKSDQHLLPGEGRINWDIVASQIAQAGYTGALTLESSMPWQKTVRQSGRITPEQYLGRAYRAIREIGRRGAIFR